MNRWIGIGLIVAGLWVGGCRTETGIPAEKPAVVMQRHLLASTTESDAIVWFSSLDYAPVDEDPGPWVQAASDGRRKDLIRLMSLQSLAERFFRPGTTVRQISKRLHNESWWDSAHSAPLFPGIVPGTVKYSMKLPGPPPSDRRTADSDIVFVVLRPMRRMPTGEEVAASADEAHASEDEVAASARGVKGARTFVIVSVEGPLHYNGGYSRAEADEDGSGSE